MIPGDTAFASVLPRPRVPHAYWTLSPRTISESGRKRVDTTRDVAFPYPAMRSGLPTDSLDPANCETVPTRIDRDRTRGTAIPGTNHDAGAHTSNAGW